MAFFKESFVAKYGISDFLTSVAIFKKYNHLSLLFFKRVQSYILNLVKSTIEIYH